MFALYNKLFFGYFKLIFLNRYQNYFRIIFGII